jgi:glycosyltransferase involved in cell wall biosynthesis
MHDVLNEPSQEFFPIPPSITTVIPTYNRPQLLRRAVKSVLCQTYPHVRVRVYADGAGEDTMEVLRNLSQEDPRVQYQRHSSRLGIGRNYLFGMEHVETPYFSFLGDDDVLLPHFYQRAMEGFQEHPQAGFCALATIVVHPRDRVAVLGSRGWQNGLHMPPASLRRMLELWPPQWTSVVFKRELIHQIGPLDVEVGNALDIDYLYRVAAHRPIVISLQPGALWVAHSGSATVQGSLAGIWPGWLKMIRNLTEDDRIPMDVRDVATRVLTQRIKELLFTDCGVRAVIAGRCAEAQRSAEILAKEFREEGEAATLRLLARVQLAFTPFGRLILLVIAGRRMLRRIWDAEYQQQRLRYLEYEKFLNLL